MRSLQLLVGSLTSLAVAAPGIHAPRSESKTGNTIKWESCEFPNATLPMECGTLRVPLDYSDPKSNDTLQLDILRTKASRGPNKGSIFLNFGGPGASGVADFPAFALNKHVATGGAHDLINVVPRGTGNTLPFSCFDSAASRAFGAQIIAGNSSETAPGRIWASGTIFAENCAAVQNKTGELIGTAFTARDMMQVVDALDEDCLLRYWGVSYGSLLGSTVVAMFPERMDKVILDGVVNPHEYYQNVETELYHDTDATFEGFCAACVAEPKQCALAGNLTAKQLEETIYAALEGLKYSPVPLAIPDYPGGGFLFDYSAAKAFIFRQLYFPVAWPGLAATLASFITGETADAGDQIETPTDATEAKDQEALQGIKCGDVLRHTSNFTEILPIFQARFEASRIAGDGADEMPARCAQWKLPAKERYDGDFAVKTKTPVLLIAGTHDPVTPAVSAHNVSASFEGSVVVEHESYGHTTLAHGSQCISDIISAYFNKGEVPEPKTVCKVIVTPFSGENGWEAVIEKFAGNSTSN